MPAIITRTPATQTDTEQPMPATDAAIKAIPDPSPVPPPAPMPEGPTVAEHAADFPMEPPPALGRVEPMPEPAAEIDPAGVFRVMKHVGPHNPAGTEITGTLAELGLARDQLGRLLTLGALEPVAGEQE